MRINSVSHTTGNLLLPHPRCVYEIPRNGVVTSPWKILCSCPKFAPPLPRV